MQVEGPTARLPTHRFGLRMQVIFFLLAIILATLLMVIVSSSLQFDRARQQNEKDAQMLAERAASAVLRVVDAQIGHLFLLSQGQPSEGFDKAQCERSATQLVRFQRRYIAMGVVDANGEVSCFSNDLGSSSLNFADRNWFQEIRDGSAASFGTLIGRRFKRLVLVGAMRIERQDPSALAAFASIDLEWIAAFLRQLGSGGNDEIVSLIDRYGQVLVHTGQNLDGYAMQPAPADLWSGIKDGAKKIRTADIDGVDRQFFIIPVHLAGQDRFYLAAGINYSSPLQEIKAILANLWGGYFILTLFAGIAGFFLTERMINKPLAHIMANLKRYESGERNIRVGPPYMSNEIGALGRALDRMADIVDIRDNEIDRRRQSVEILAQRLKAIIDASPVPIVWLTADWKVQLWNRAAERVFGYSAEQTLGQNPPIVPEDQVEASRGLMTRVFAGETIQDIDLKRRHKDGHMLDVRASLAPLSTMDGNVDGCLVIFIDETERRLIEQQFAQAQKMEALGQLTGGLSHDFNNLLGVVIGNMDFLLDGLDDKPELKHFAQSALNAALQGAELNKRLLAFARRQPLAPQPIQTGREIANVTVMLKRALGELYTVESDVALDVWPVRADATQLHAALLNLGLNARDAMPGGGRLLIEAKNRRIDADMAEAVASGFPPGDYVCLSVSDTGAGIPEAVLKRIFEPFFTTKEVGKGTGLGLSMVHGFAKQSGGNITVYSEVGVGTTFRLYLPRLGQDEAGGEDVQGNVRLLTQRPIKVLLAEDNAGLRLVARQQLMMIGCQVMEAENAVLALRILESSAEIDLLLTDIVMPGGMNGRELAARAAQLRPGLKILLMSGYSDPRHEGDGERENVVSPWRMLTKPFRRQELHEAISLLLHQG